MSRSALLRNSPAQEPWPRTHLITSRVSLSRHLTSRADVASYLVYVGRHMPLAKGRGHPDLCQEIRGVQPSRRTGARLVTGHDPCRQGDWPWLTVL
jgi:hypothetical protein